MENPNKLRAVQILRNVIPLVAIIVVIVIAPPDLVPRSRMGIGVSSLRLRPIPPTGTLVAQPGFFFSEGCWSPRGDDIQVQYRPQEPFDDSVERFFASLRFAQRGKLDQFDFQLDNKAT
jgi:hypothetical protein